jgi:hypothetical protein
MIINSSGIIREVYYFLASFTCGGAMSNRLCKQKKAGFKLYINKSKRNEEVNVAIKIS